MPGFFTGFYGGSGPCISKSPSSAPPVVRSEQELSVRVAAAVKKIFLAAFVVLGTVVGNLLTFGVPMLFSAISYVQNRNIKQQIEERQIEHLSSVLHCSLKGADRWKRSETGVELSLDSLNSEVSAPHENQRCFHAGVVRLRNQIGMLEAQKERGEVSVGSVEGVYAEFQELVQDPKFIAGYNSLKATDHSGVNFVKLLAVKFRCADVSNLLIEHAKNELGQDIAGKGHIETTGKVLACYRKNPSFQKNVFWAISHPFDWYHSLISRYVPEGYESHASNPTYKIHEVVYERREQPPVTVQFVAGPTPCNDPVYREIFSTAGNELRGNIMDLSKRGNEAGWIQQIDTIAQESKGRIQHMVWGFETKKKRGFLKEGSVSGLIDQYQDELLQSGRSLDSATGVTIRKNLLSDEEIRRGCARAKQLVTQLNPDLKDPKARHAVLVMVDTMLAVGAAIKYLDGLDVGDAHDPDMKAAQIAIACKQCFDRGPVYLSAFLLFFRSLTNAEALNENEFYQLAGLPLFRAPLHEGREQIQSKFAVYEQFARILGENMATLSECTRAFQEDLRRSPVVRTH